jgi:hypothetical protein
LAGLGGVDEVEQVEGLVFSNLASSRPRKASNMSLPFEKRNDLINGIEVYGTIGVFSKDSFANFEDLNLRSPKYKTRRIQKYDNLRRSTYISK